MASRWLGASPLEARLTEELGAEQGHGKHQPALLGHRWACASWVDWSPCPVTHVPPRRWQASRWAGAHADCLQEGGTLPSEVSFAAESQQLCPWCSWDREGRGGQARRRLPGTRGRAGAQTGQAKQGRRGEWLHPDYGRHFTWSASFSRYLIVARLLAVHKNPKRRSRL